MINNNEVYVVINKEYNDISVFDNKDAAEKYSEALNKYFGANTTVSIEHVWNSCDWDSDYENGPFIYPTDL